MSDIKIIISAYLHQKLLITIKSFSKWMIYTIYSNLKSVLHDSNKTYKILTIINSAHKTGLYIEIGGDENYKDWNTFLKNNCKTFKF